MNYIDTQIPVPWGHIAVRQWGDETNEAVLVIHGILDNVGAFERLIALLPTNFYYICIDLPGHGQSSHLPQHAVYDSLNNLLVYKRVVDYYKREKYILMGHSYGGQLAIMFAQIYPEYVQKLIMLDSIYLFPTHPKAFRAKVKTFHETYFATEEKLLNNSAPEYEYEELLNKMMNNRRYGSITREAAEKLLDRMMIKLDNGNVKMTTDQRLKFFQNPPFDFDFIVKFLKAAPIQCRVLIIGAKESEVISIYFKKVYNEIKKIKNVKIVVVEGNHDVHNSYPERVAPHVIRFLLNSKNKL